MKRRCSEILFSQVLINFRFHYFFIQNIFYSLLYTENYILYFLSHLALNVLYMTRDSLSHPHLSYVILERRDVSRFISGETLRKSRHFSRFLFYNSDWRIASGNSIKPRDVIGKSAELSVPSTVRVQISVLRFIVHVVVWWQMLSRHMYRVCKLHRFPTAKTSPPRKFL